MLCHIRASRPAGVLLLGFIPGRAVSWPLSDLLKSGGGGGGDGHAHGSRRERRYGPQLI